MILKRLPIALQVLKNIFKSNKVNKQELFNVEEKISLIAANKADIQLIKTLEERLQALEHSKAAVSVVEDLRGSLGVLETGKADRSAIDDIRKTFEQIVSYKVDTQRVDDIMEIVRKLDTEKAGVGLIDELRDMIGTIEKQKSDLQTVYELRSTIEAVNSGKADMHIIDGIIGQLNKIEKDIVNRQDIEGINHALEDILTQLKNQKYTILNQERQLMVFLDEAQKCLSEPRDTEKLNNILAEEGHLFDALFVSFEDIFRGTRENIKNRLKIYLPFIQQIHAVTSDSPVLDMGCGRGEWLELLREHGYSAKGIDVNRVMVQQCQERGFDVVESDAIEYLKSLSSNSVGVVTGFHIIEHLPLRKLIQLLDESLRVLRPGGMVLFETPNPKNLVVGACNFYTDPTHLKPIFPETIKFQLEQRGFARAELKYVNPVEGSPFTDNDEKNEMFHNWFFGARDFAVIGYKA